MSQAYYLQMLAESHRLVQERDGQPRSRLEFLADHVFDFTTYDTAMSERFATRAVEVARAITEARTLAYTATSDGHYEWYLLMANMPFFAGRLDWGTSIRGAWWRHCQHELESCGLYLNGQQVGNLYFSSADWVSFMMAVACFAEGDQP